jgi:AcrR family transcriptional regulator
MSEAIAPGLRERKAAKTRIALINATARQLRTKSFQEINIEDLCEEVMISKVTFFAYFSTKDHLLWYLSSVWIYRMVVDCRKSGKEGIAGLRFLFEEMAKVFNNSINMYSAFATINPQQLRKAKHELTAADKLELYPNGSTLQMEVRLSMGYFLHQNTKLAIERNEIKTSLNDIELATLFGALYQGSGLVGLRIDPERPGDTYLVTFNNLMKLITP